MGVEEGRTARALSRLSPSACFLFRVDETTAAETVLPRPLSRPSWRPRPSPSMSSVSAPALAPHNRDVGHFRGQGRANSGNLLASDRRDNSALHGDDGQVQVTFDHPFVISRVCRARWAWSSHMS